MKINFKPYALLTTDNVDIYEVHSIVIDEYEKSIDVCDEMNMSMGKIWYEDLEEVACLKYDHHERLVGDSEIIIKNGEIYKGDGIMRRARAKKMMEKVNNIIDKYLNVERIDYLHNISWTHVEINLYDYLDKPGNFEDDIECIIHAIQPVVPTEYTISQEYYSDEYWDGENMVESNLSCRITIKYIGDNQ